MGRLKTLLQSFGGSCFLVFESLFVKDRMLRVRISALTSTPDANRVDENKTVGSMDIKIAAGNLFKLPAAVCGGAGLLLVNFPLLI